MYIPEGSAFSFTGDPYLPSSTSFDLALGDQPDPWMDWQPPPGVIASAAAPWNKPPIKHRSSIHSADRAARRNLDRVVGHNLPPVKNAAPIFKWAKKPQLDIARAEAWDDSIDAKNIAPIFRAKKARKVDLAPWVELWDSSITSHDINSALPFIVKTPIKDKAKTLGHYNVNPHAIVTTWLERYPFDGYIAGLTTFDLGNASEWQGAADFVFGRTYKNDPSQPKQQRITAGFIDAPRKYQAESLPWGPGGRINTDYDFEHPGYIGPITPEGEPIPITEQESYIIVNTVNAVKLPERTAIAIENVQIQYDIDSWAWSFSGDIVGKASLNPLIPNAGTLVDIEIEINGHTFVFMVERYRQNRAFASDRYTIEGVSRTQYLAAPYAPKMSQSSAAQINAVQAATALLTGSGITLNWPTQTDGDTPDWTLPANAWSYQGRTPAEAMQALVASAGAVMLATRNANEITVQPRFRVSPWALASAPLNQIDVLIPLSMATDISMQWVPAELYDSIIVGGVNFGVISNITRNGTPGTASAPDIFDEYCVATTVNTERARQEIAASGSRALYSVTLPIPEVGAAPGIIEPGAVCELQEPGETAWRGYVLATSIQAQGSGVTAVNQTIEVVRLYDH